MAKEIHAKNNVTVYQAMEILQFAKSAYDAAKKAYDVRGTAQKMKFSIKDFFSKCEQTAISCGFVHIY